MKNINLKSFFSNAGSVIGSILSFLFVYILLKDVYEDITNKKKFNELINSVNEINKKLFEAFRNEGRVRAVPSFKNGSFDDTNNVLSLSEALFGRDESENKDAIKGFLLSPARFFWTIFSIGPSLSYSLAFLIFYSNSFLFCFFNLIG